MGSSFQEQLVKLGLADKKQLAKAKKTRYQEKKKRPEKKTALQEENERLANEALRKKRERAHQLNQEREARRREREKAAKIRQIIETGRLEKDDKGVAYRFVDQKKIYRVFVSRDLVSQLEKGQAGVVRLGEGYEVCPAAVIAKIKELDASLVVSFHETSQKVSDEDDPYAGYEIPDDLDW